MAAIQKTALRWHPSRHAKPGQKLGDPRYADEKFLKYEQNQDAYAQAVNEAQERREVEDEARRVARAREQVRRPHCLLPPDSVSERGKARPTRKPAPPADPPRM